MTLSDLLRHFASVSPSGVADDSRRVRPGDLFLAYPQGRAYIATALKKGAVGVCWAPGDGFAWNPEWDVPNLAVPELRQLAGPLAHELAGHPSERLQLIAVTGTNGKTTISQWLAQALPACAVIGTLGAGFLSSEPLQATGFTTPEAPLFSRLLADFVAQGAGACALEASSIGIEEGRLAGSRVDTAIFTNLTHDHLDYHGDMAAYAAAKAKLFCWPGLRLAVVNLDDAFGEKLLRLSTAQKTVGFSLAGHPEATIRAEALVDTATGQQFRLLTPDGAVEISVRLIGRYNVANLLAVAAVLWDRGFSVEKIAASLMTLTPPPGRMACYGGEGEPLVVVDYAHTPDALKNALGALRPLAKARGGHLYVLFGCGGDRDRKKRPEMGRIAAELADHVWLTSDNPRSERPDAILQDIVAGCKAYTDLRAEQEHERFCQECRRLIASLPKEEIQDRLAEVLANSKKSLLQSRVSQQENRAFALWSLLQNKTAADVVLLAGKGHEAYMEIAGKRQPYGPDGKLAMELLQQQRNKDLNWRRDGQMQWHLLNIAECLQQGLRPWWFSEEKQRNLIRLCNVNDNRVWINGVATDSRADCSGKLFVALKGERFDAHDYLAQAVAQGATALLVSDENKLPADIPAFVVRDTRVALATLAWAWRVQFRYPVIGLTGSNGKTTTREMMVSILRAAYGEEAVLATEGNFNNDIGLPLTLLRLNENHRVAVIEMGMNHPGEIEYLTEIAEPDVALVTNAGHAHLEGMGDLDGVAREKGSIYQYTKSPGLAGLGLDSASGFFKILNEDDPHAEFWLQQPLGGTVYFGPRAYPEYRCDVIAFGMNPDLKLKSCDEVDAYCKRQTRFLKDGYHDFFYGQARIAGLKTHLVLCSRELPPTEVVLSVPGLHNARNALAAVAAVWSVLVGWSCPIPVAKLPELIRQGLESFTGVPGRLQTLVLANGVTLLNDTYNANPDSVRAGIAVLAATIGPKFLALGDMGEIGESSAQLHDEIGGYAKSMGVDKLYTLGELSRQATRNFGDGATHFSTPEALAAQIVKDWNGQATVLVKGSRFMKMERVTNALVAAASPAQPKETS